MTQTNLAVVEPDRTQFGAALTTVKKENPDAGAVIEAFVKAMAVQDIRTLGDNQLFVIRSADGKAVAVKRRVPLSLDNGGLVKVGSKPDSPIIISAEGYERLAEAANVIVMNTPTVVIDGKDEMNPYVRRDKNGQIQEIVCRSVAFGYTSTGIPTISDRTSTFSVDLYRLVDLLGKAKYNKNAFKLLPAEMAPVPDDSKTWARYPFDDSTNLWIDTSHSDAIGWYAQNTNRLKKAMEFAQTFSQRNALKHHPAIARQKSPGNLAFWNVDIIGWLQAEGTFKWNLGAYGEMMETATAIADGKIDDTGAQVLKGIDHVENESEEDNLTTVMDTSEVAEDQSFEGNRDEVNAPVPTQEPTQPATTEQPLRPILQKRPIIQKIIAAQEFVGDDIFNQALKQCDLETKPLEVLSDEEACNLNAAINTIIDAEG